MAYPTSTNYLTNQYPDGWTPCNEVWTYSTATASNGVYTGTVTTPGDQTSKYRVGDKIKLTQTTVKYFYIYSLSYSSITGLTTIVLTGGTTYVLTNAGITLNYYSKMSPQGFPVSFAYPIYVSSGGGTPPQFSDTSCNFWVADRTVHFSIWCSGDGGNEGAGANDTLFSIPIPTSFATSRQIGAGQYANAAAIGGIYAWLGSTTTLFFRLDNVFSTLQNVTLNNATRYVLANVAYPI